MIQDSSKGSLESSRTLPVSINEPGTPPSSGQSGSRGLVFFFVVFLGFAFAGFGAYVSSLQSAPWVGGFMLATGISIAAPGLLSWTYRKFLFQELKAELEQPAQHLKEHAAQLIDEAAQEVKSRLESELDRASSENAKLLDKYRDEIGILKATQNAGICGVYANRRAAVGAFAEHLQAEERDIRIIGSSLLGFLQSPDTEFLDAHRILKDKIQNGVRVMFLLTHPVVADWRARQENRSRGDIGKEIRASLNVLLNDWGMDPSCIKVYQGAPTCFGIRTSSTMLLNFYPYMQEAYLCPCLIVQNDHYFFSAFDSMHFRAWNSSMARPLPESIDKLWGFTQEDILHILDPADGTSDWAPDPPTPWPKPPTLGDDDQASDDVDE